MKIALVTPFDVTHPGGVTEHVLHLGEELLALGHTVALLAPATARRTAHPRGRTTRGEGGAAGDEKRWRQAAFYGFGRPIALPTNGSTARVSLDLTRLREMRRLMERERFDVVHVHAPLTPIVPWLALLASDAVNVGTFHAYRSGSTGYAALRHVLGPLLDRLDGRIAVSDPAHSFISRYFPGQYDVIPNGVSVDRFGGEIAPLPWAGAAPTVLFVGRHDEPRKGLRTLLIALRQLLRQVPDARLVVVGPGDPRRHRVELAALAPAAEKAVTFAGTVSADELPRYYASADVACFPATGSESFGIVLLEGMAAGRPVVATEIPGYTEVLSGGREGILVPPGVPSALASALARLLLDPALRQRLGAAGRETASRFAWPRVAAQVLEAYERARLTAGLDGGRRTTGTA